MTSNPVQEIFSQRTSTPPLKDPKFDVECNVDTQETSHKSEDSHQDFYGSGKQSPGSLFPVSMEEEDPLPQNQDPLLPIYELVRSESVEETKHHDMSSLKQDVNFVFDDNSSEISSRDQSFCASVVGDSLSTDSTNHPEEDFRMEEEESNTLEESIEATTPSPPSENLMSTEDISKENEAIIQKILESPSGLKLLEILPLLQRVIGRMTPPLIDRYSKKRASKQGGKPTEAQRESFNYFLKKGFKQAEIKCLFASLFDMSQIQDKASTFYNTIHKVFNKVSKPSMKGGASRRQRLRFMNLPVNNITGSSMSVIDGSTQTIRTQQHSLLKHIINNGFLGYRDDPKKIILCEKPEIREYLRTKNIEIINILLSQIEDSLPLGAHFELHSGLVKVSNLKKNGVLAGKTLFVIYQKVYKRNGETIARPTSTAPRKQLSICGELGGFENPIAIDDAQERKMNKKCLSTAGCGIRSRARSYKTTPRKFAAFNSAVKREESTCLESPPNLSRKGSMHRQIERAVEIKKEGVVSKFIDLTPEESCQGSNDLELMSFVDFGEDLLLGKRDEEELEFGGDFDFCYSTKKLHTSD